MNVLHEPCKYLEFYGYSIAYFDTNIYHTLFAEPESWESIHAFLTNNNLILGVSDANILELSDKLSLHRDLARFLLTVPSAWLKPAMRIVGEEVQAYLNGTRVSPIVGPIPRLILESDDPVGDLGVFFQGEVVSKERSRMVQQKPLFEKRIHDTRENFGPADNSGRFTAADGPRYAFQLILFQFLLKEKDWRICAARIFEEIKNASTMNLAVLSQFRGLWLFALAQFYRYYLHRRKPSGNDYGDFVQVFPIPYCRYAIVERHLSEELMHIKKNDPILEYTEIHDIEFLRKLTGLPLGRRN